MIENLAMLGGALFLVLLNAFFVAAEFAIVKIRGTRVEELASIHGWRGRILAAVHARLDAYLSACQLGITLASLGLGWIGEPAFAHLLEIPAGWLGLDHDPERLKAVAFFFAFSLISFLHIVVGELAPKSMAIRRPEAVSLWTAAPLWAFYWLMYPFIRGLNASANWVLRVAGLGLQDGHAHEAPYSREELRSILHLSRPATEGTEKGISSYVRHALELPDLEVSDLMRPRRELVSIPANAQYEEVRQLVRMHRYSRYPVLGHDKAFRGILHIKDIFMEEAGPDYPARLERRLHKPIYVLATRSVAELLHRFQDEASHFALVQQAEDGRVVGFLSLEDVLETVFGEITDEHERDRKQQIRRDPVWEGADTLIARGDTPLFRIERELGREIEGSEEIGTLSGLLMRGLDSVPKTGDFITHDGLLIEVEAAHGPRVNWVRILSADPAVPIAPGQTVQADPAERSQS
ncbi:MAG TPA: hemolysin family protein [Vicinamibacterales bacterium]|nr:hemolysin family protein [Vicinamibacterales bacterium]